MNAILGDKTFLKITVKKFVSEDFMQGEYSKTKKLYIKEPKVLKKIKNDCIF